MAEAAAPAPPRRTRRRVRLLLAGVSAAFALGAGEIVARIATGFRPFSLRLRHVLADNPDAAEQVAFHAKIVAPFVEHTTAERVDLDAEWLKTSPPPLVRPPVPDRLERRFAAHKEWLLLYDLNEVLLRAMWQPGKGLPQLTGLDLPDDFSVFAPPGGKPVPLYRYPPSCTLPTGMTVNAFGFRGRELAVDKPARTVRIGFVGASTTVEAPRLPHSAPELIEHWLSLWAKKRGLDVRFETLNAAREAIKSADLRAIVEDELVPLCVDYVVYYEGANQFQPVTLLKHVRVDGAYQVAVPPPGRVGTFDGQGTPDADLLDRLCAWSALAQLARSLREVKLVEPEKPAQEVVLPDGFGGAFPLARAGEVLECGAIGGDLDGIAAALSRAHARLVLCTFAWLAQDGMAIEPIHRNIHIHLNRAYWPLRYSSVRKLADLQNAFFRAFAGSRHLPLIDVANELPKEQDLYDDAIHHTEFGVRLKAWVMFCRLTEILDRDLAAKKVPVPDDHPDTMHPNLAKARIVTRAELDTGR